MKKLMAWLLLLASFSFFAAGCAEEKQGEEHPATEHPAQQEAPKDHPAH